MAIVPPAIWLPRPVLYAIPRRSLPRWLYGPDAGYYTLDRDGKRLLCKPRRSPWKYGNLDPARQVTRKQIAPGKTVDCTPYASPVRSRSLPAVVKALPGTRDDREKLRAA